jgi:2-keto-3-deoxy-L-rhamnonate aldolase RhmA
MLATDLKKKLRNREPVFLGWTSLGHPQIAEMLVRSSIDCVGIDLEHSTIDQAQSQRIIAACQSSYVPCLPRVASKNSESIRRLLDSGANGVILPTVETPEQVQWLIETAKYPPLGGRGFGVARAQGYGHDFEEYASTWNDTSILIIQVETIVGVNNISELLKFEEVDAVMLGPYDISGSLGIPGKIEDPRVLEAGQKVVRACEKYGKACGTHIIDVKEEAVANALSSGYTFIALSSDVFILQEWARTTRNLIKTWRR